MVDKIMNGVARVDRKTKFLPLPLHLILATLISSRFKCNVSLTLEFSAR